MPRVQLTALDRYEFTMEILVRTTDLNYGGHLGNDRLLTLVHEARVAFLESHNWSEMDCGGAALIMGDVAIVYKGEAFAGDRLVFRMAAGEPTRCGFRIFHNVTRKNDGSKIALVETGMTCFDYEQRKITPLPDAVRQVCTFA
jgi:acyl-CoA thioester hydrolase